MYWGSAAAVSEVQEREEEEEEEEALPALSTGNESCREGRGREDMEPAESIPGEG